MINIIFESHGTTYDNLNKVSSGHADVELSSKDIENAKELGARYKDQEFDVIFCSDLLRSYKTAELAFGDKYKIIKDARLRECDYGDLTKHPAEEVEPQKINHITIPFPNGESYEDGLRRMKLFLDDLKTNYEGKKVLIIGHRVTQYGLEHWIKNKSLEELLTTPFRWQPGWEYQY